MINTLKDYSRVITPVKEASFRVFMALDALGVHLMPKHYYTPVPDFRWLRTNRQLWMGRARLAGFDWDLDRQVAWLEATCAPYYDEVRGLQLYASVGQYGEGFGEIESQVLHCVLRTVRPRRIIEVGSGVSTACMVHAIGRNGAAPAPTQITCIEPYPKQAFSGLTGVRHIPQFCQEVADDVFQELTDGDLLFIDSTHSVKVGSDVVHLFLKVIPFLQPGVYIHIHDINLPYLYYRDALENYFGWQETALLLALLTGNSSLAVLCSLSALHYDRPAQLRQLLPDYRPQANDEGLRPSPDAPGHFPSSIWLRTG